MKPSNPIPVFPTAGADPHARTPIAKQIEAAAANAVLMVPPRTGIPTEVIREIATAMIADILNEYAATLEAAAMEAAHEGNGCGIAAIWHGTQYAILLTPRVPPGYLIEERCDCGRHPSEVN